MTEPAETMYTYHVNQCKNTHNQPLIEFFFEKIHPRLLELRELGIKKCDIGFGVNGCMYIGADDHDIRVSNPERYTYRMFNEMFSHIVLDDRMELDDLVVKEKISRNGYKFFTLKWANISFDESMRLFDEFITPYLSEIPKTTRKCCVYLSGSIIIKTDDGIVKNICKAPKLVDYSLFKTLLHSINLASRMGVDNIKISEKCSNDDIMYFELTW